MSRITQATEDASADEAMLHIARYDEATDVMVGGSCERQIKESEGPRHNDLILILRTGEIVRAACHSLVSKDGITVMVERKYGMAVEGGSILDFRIVPYARLTGLEDERVLKGDWLMVLGPVALAK